jgi:hypothetical protein
MNPLRIYFLRILAGTILLPFFAIAVLVLLHKVIFPTSYFNDWPVVAGLWGILLFLSHIVLAKIGEKRFDLLDKLGWNFLQANDSLLLAQVFENLDKLFDGGLLSPKRHRELEKLALRRYFAFYHENIAEAKFRASLVKCLHARIREQEAYNALKAYLLKQTALTLELVDLAEILHEFQPDDRSIIRFMTEKYLQENQKHHRAEYFYRKALETESALTPEIIDLCLQRALSQQRRDAFAGWLYFRAYRNDDTNSFPDLPEQIYKTSRWYAFSERNDDLAENLAAIASGFDEQKIAEWEKAEQERLQKQLPAKIERAKYYLAQKMIFAWEEIKRQRKYVYYAGAGFALVLVIFLSWPASRPESAEQVKTINPVIDDSQARFALQVGALKSAGRAQREVERLQKAGLDAYVIPPSGRSRYHRVRLGKFLTKNAALAQGDSLRQIQLIRDFFVVNFVRQTE